MTLLLCLVLASQLLGCGRRCEDPYAAAYGEAQEWILEPDADGIYPSLAGQVTLVSSSSDEDIYYYGVGFSVEPLDSSVGSSSFGVIEVNGGTSGQSVRWISGGALGETGLEAGAHNRCSIDCRGPVDFIVDVASDYGEPIVVVATPWVVHLDCNPNAEAQFDLEIERL